MTVFNAFILGLVQGLGEFLPISSSGHLILVPWFMNFQDPGLSFSVALHIGTLIALLMYFYKDWMILTKALFTSLKKSPKNYSHHERMIWYLILASVPGAIGGILLEDWAETVFRQPLLVAIQLALAGILLALVDYYYQQERDFTKITLKDALLIGCAQVIALIPGTSRSGITITMARYLKIDRVTAARFSFLLATPITAGACLLKLKDIIHSGVDLNFWIGVSTSLVVGMLSIKYLLYFMRQYSYRVFAYYRVILAVIIVVGILLGNK